MKINIGPKTLLEKIPVLIDLNGDPFILHSTDGMPVLYSAICPHQHNVVSEFHETFWKCPSHDWTFDTNTGQSINTPQKCLTKFLVEENNGSLFVTLPEKIKNKIKPLSNKKINPKISVVGSAALLIQWESFNIICDPWIEGPAVFGSWITYPPSNLTIDDLPKIDAILISHEHSDHLHQFTLSKLDKKIPVYVPDVDNKRLSHRLEKLGFENIISLHSGVPQKIENEIQLTSFNSGSVWSDNIFYIQLGNFSILNINDAGFNWAIKNAIDSVDLLCIQFSPGSGFPSTWTHLNEKSKLEIMNSRNQGMLRMIQQITEIMNPKFILPFANFNTLYLPEHQKYVKTQPKNTPNDIVDLFKEDNHVKVIDIFPGESWDGKNNSFDTQNDHDKFYERDFMFSYLNNPKRHDENEKFVPKNFDLEFNEIKNYFEDFNDSKLTQSIGDYVIQLVAENKEKKIDCIIEFKEGLVTCSKNNNKKFHMKMSCPGGIIQEIIRNDLSWDELQAGYWAEYERNPDVYNIALWQLFHAPWQARKNYSLNQNNHKEFTFDKKTAIADIIENGDQKTIEVFEKFGLYCVGCESSVGENIEDGCSIHGLTQSQTNDLIKELKLLQNKE